MSTKFKFHLAAPIKWPYKCAESPYFVAMAYIFISIVFLAIIIFSKRWLPVRLINIGDIFFTIVIKNKDYEKEFASINESIIRVQNNRQSKN